VSLMRGNTDQNNIRMILVSRVISGPGPGSVLVEDVGHAISLL